MRSLSPFKKTPIAAKLRKNAGQSQLERIRVGVRVRNLNRTTELGHENVAICEGNEIRIKFGLYHDVKASFDLVFDEATQAEVFDQIVEPLIPHYLQGYNCTVFTYG